MTITLTENDLARYDVHERTLFRAAADVGVVAGIGQLGAKGHPERREAVQAAVQAHTARIPAELRIGGKARAKGLPDRLAKLCAWLVAEGPASEATAPPEAKPLTGDAKRANRQAAKQASFDPHRLRASRMFAVPPEEVTPVQRNTAKAVGLHESYSADHVDFFARLRIKGGDRARIEQTIDELLPAFAELVRAAHPDATVVDATQGASESVGGAETDAWASPSPLDHDTLDRLVTDDENEDEDEEHEEASEDLAGMLGDNTRAEDGGWCSGPSAPFPVLVAAKDTSYVHMVRAKGDPQRITREQLPVEERGMGRINLTKRRLAQPIEEFRHQIASDLHEHGASTFNAISVRLTGATADITGDTSDPNTLVLALAELVREEVVEHEDASPIHFRLTGLIEPLEPAPAIQAPAPKSPAMSAKTAKTPKAPKAEKVRESIGRFIEQTTGDGGYGRLDLGEITLGVHRNLVIMAGVQKPHEQLPEELAWDRTGLVERHS
jgi:hypothetical protein